LNPRIKVLLRYCTVAESSSEMCSNLASRRPNAITHNALMAWTCDGRSGYGVVMKNHSLTWLTSRRGRFHDGPTAAVYA